MAEIATIARPYAEALFQASRADLNATQAWLGPLGAIVADMHVLQYAAAPQHTNAQVFDLIAGLLPMPLTGKGENFLRMVIEQGKLAALPQIAQQFHVLKNASVGVSDARVTSAFPMDAGQVAELQVLLEKKFDRKLQVQVWVDSRLIGGVRVQVGDEVMDASIQARLEQMKVALSA